jgi:uncharacterized protein (DUF488 family)
VKSFGIIWMSIRCANYKFEDLDQFRSKLGLCEKGVRSLLHYNEYIFQCFTKFLASVVAKRLARHLHSGDPGF